MSQNLPLTPEVPIYNPAFNYIPAAQTDIRKTWERFGYKAPSENKGLTSPNSSGL
jgi:hypothetical protein